MAVEATTEVTFVNEELASAYDCGICLGKLRNPVAVCDDQLMLLYRLTKEP